MRAGRWSRHSSLFASKMTLRTMKTPWAAFKAPIGLRPPPLEQVSQITALTPGVGILYFARCAQPNRVQPLHSQHQTHPLAFVTQHAPHCLQDTAATPASPMRLAWLRAPERIPCSRSKHSISGVSGVSQSHAPPFTHGSCYRTGVLSLCACRHQQGCTHEGVPCRGSTADVVWVHDAAPALNYGAAGPPAASAQLRHV